MLRFCFALAICVGLAFPAGAEPGSVENYLMNTPTSEFSFGLYRMQEMLDRDDHGRNGYSTIGYDWDKNRLVINYLSLKEPEATQTACANVVNDIRWKGFVDATTGKALAGSSLYASSFGPIGFDRKNAPKDFQKELDKIIKIHVILYTSDQKTRVVCEGDLLSPKVLFEESPTPKATQSKK